MSKNTQLTTLAVNTEADAFAALMNDGYLDIYDGSQPANGDVAISGQTLGVSIRFGAPAFLPAVAGLIAANPMTPGVIAASINPATWGRVYRSDHVTPVMDVSVGTSDANVVLPTTNLVAGVTVTVGSFTHTVAKSTPNN